MWHQGFNYNFAKLQEYLLCAKEIKNKNELFNNSSPPSYHLLPFWRVLQNVIKLISAVNVRGDECNQHWGTRALWYSPKWWKMVTQGRRIAEESRYFCFVCAKKVKLRKSEVEWSELRGEELLKKVVIFVLLREKSEVSQKWCLVKSEAVTWTASSMFLDLEHFSCFAANGWSENCQISSKIP